MIGSLIVIGVLTLTAVWLWFQWMKIDAAYVDYRDTHQHEIDTLRRALERAQEAPVLEDGFLEASDLRNKLAAKEQEMATLQTSHIETCNDLAHEKRSNASLRGTVTRLTSKSKK